MKFPFILSILASQVIIFAEDISHPISDLPSENEVDADPCDVDSDGDGTPDCRDECPHNHEKVIPGECGCGLYKFNPGQCGCLEWDIDSDGDGVADCVDQCPHNPQKTEKDFCGCENKHCEEPVQNSYKDDIIKELAENQIVIFLLEDRVLGCFVGLTFLIVLAAIKLCRYNKKERTLPLDCPKISLSDTGMMLNMDKLGKRRTSSSFTFSRPDCLLFSATKEEERKEV